MAAQVSLIRLPEVRCRVGLSKAAIYARISVGTFPRPVRIGVRSVGWVESEVTEWIEQRIRESRRNPI